MYLIAAIGHLCPIPPGFIIYPRGSIELHWRGVLRVHRGVLGSLEELTGRIKGQGSVKWCLLIAN